MKELICINIGQTGVQISNAMWELFCLEHALDFNGETVPNTERTSDSLFLEVTNNKYTPRCLMIDLEPTVIDEIRTGKYRQLFNPAQLISGLEDSSCNFARGHFTVGKIYLTDFLSSLRKQIEQCHTLQGFMIINSFGGGCGSGFTSLALDQMSLEYTKSTKLQFSVVPSQHMVSAIVEPYNFILSSKSCNSAIDISFQHDNQSLWNCVRNRLNITNPTFTTVNRILAQIFSTITVSVRHENALNNDISQIATNIIPFPRLHYILSFYSPIYNNSKGRHSLITTTTITKDVFNLNNKLLDSDFLGEKFISCCLQYRGNISPIQVNQALLEIKKLDSIKFVDWCPTGFKIGINKIPSIIPKSCELFDTDCSVLLMCNNTCFHQKLGQQISAFEHLFRKRSFVHWFVGEGMEEGEFFEAKDEFLFLREDYKCLNVDEENYQDINTDPEINEYDTTIAEKEFRIYTEDEIEKHISDNIPEVMNRKEVIEDLQEDHDQVREDDTEVDQEDNSEKYLTKSFDTSHDQPYDKIETEEVDDDDESRNTTSTPQNDDLTESTSLLNIALEKNKLYRPIQISEVAKSINDSDRLIQLTEYLNKKSDSTHTEISPL